MFSAKKDLVGIDVGASSVKVVSLRESRGTYQLAALGIMPLEPEVIIDNTIMDTPAVIDAVTNLLGSLKIKTKKVATSVSGHAVIIRKINLPLMTEVELESSIQWEAEQYIPFDISEVNIDFQILGPDPKDPAQMDVMLVAAKKDFVDDYTSVFVEAGLVPTVMDIDCFALENMFDYNYGFVEGEVIALVDLGSSATNVNVMRGQTSIFTRDIQTGGNLLNQDLQKRLGISHIEAERVKMGQFEDLDIEPDAVNQVLDESVENLVQEVQRSLDFFMATSSDERVSKVYLGGGLSASEKIRSALEQRLDISVEQVNPFRNITVNEKQFDAEYLDAVGPMFSVAAGLAMRKVADK